MAHKGVFYPVNFRRDWNLNLDSNTFGWPQRYWCQWQGLPPGTANIVNNFFFLTGLGVIPVRNELTYISPFVLVPVFQFRTRVYAQINDGINFIYGAELISKTGGIIMAVHWNGQSRGNLPQWPNLDYPIVDFWSPDWFDAAPGFVICRCFPNTWDNTPLT